jgi:hypothetical protein
MTSAAAMATTTMSWIGVDIYSRLVVYNWKIIIYKLVTSSTLDLMPIRDWIDERLTTCLDNKSQSCCFMIQRAMKCYKIDSMIYRRYLFRQIRWSCWHTLSATFIAWYHRITEIICRHISVRIRRLFLWYEFNDEQCFWCYYQVSLFKNAIFWRRWRIMFYISCSMFSAKSNIFNSNQCLLQIKDTVNYDRDNIHIIFLLT